MSALLVAVAGDDASLGGVAEALEELGSLPGRRSVLLTWTPDDPAVAPMRAREIGVDAVVDLGELLDPGHPDSWRSRGELAERGLLLRALAASVDATLPPAGVDVVVSVDPEHPATESLLLLFPEAVLHPEPAVPEPEPEPEVAARPVVVTPAPPARRSLRQALSRRVRALR